MAECAVCLPLSEAQLHTVKKVLGLKEAPVVQLSAVHKDHVIRYGMIPPGKPRHDFHPLYLVDIPDPLHQMRIFFTDEQKKLMKEEGIELCDFVEVEPIELKTPPPVSRYAILVPHNTKYAIPVYAFPIPPAGSGD